MDNQSLTGLAGAGDLKITAKVTKDEESLSAAYELSPEHAKFFKEETRIEDDDELRTHILSVQERAYKIFPYPCIKGLMFLRPSISTHPEYEHILKLGQERSDGILLDVGCCFGVDARKAVADGFPLENTVTTDLHKEFYDLGHALFRTTPATYPISFVAGDAFDSDMLQIIPPSDEPASTETPDLHRLTSLNRLAGRCAVIYTSNFFHLFSEEKQLHLAKALAGLLSPEPGSTICGGHAGFWEKRIYHGVYAGREWEMFQHSPKSWTELWDGGVFEKGKVMVNARIHELEAPAGLTFIRLEWSVVRL